MGIFGPKRRSGSEVFGYFAANDRELSAWLNALPQSERAALIGTLDGVLRAPSQALFEEGFGNLCVQLAETVDGSEQEARLQALTRMLGYEYKRVYRGEPHLIAAMAQKMASNSDEEDSVEEFFTRIARQMYASAKERDDLLEQDKALAGACLLTAAAVATFIANHDSSGDPDDGFEALGTIAEVGESEDENSAFPILWSIGWYYALNFVAPYAHEMDRDTWLHQTTYALGALEEVDIVPDASVRLKHLYDSRMSATDENHRDWDSQLARWFLLHCGVDESALDADIVAAGWAMKAACVNYLETFKIYLQAAGLR